MTKIDDEVDPRILDIGKDVYKQLSDVLGENPGYFFVGVDDDGGLSYVSNLDEATAIDIMRHIILCRIPPSDAIN